MIVLTGLLPGGWLLLGLLVLGPAFVADTSPAAALVVAVGGVLLAHRALRSLVGGLTQLLGARVASESIAPMFHATAGQERVSPVLRGELDPAGEPAPALTVLPARQPGWNKYTVPVAVADLKPLFADAQIVWKDSAAYSANANTVAQIAGTAGVIVLRRTEGGRNLEIVARNLDIPTRTSFVWL